MRGDITNESDLELGLGSSRQGADGMQVLDSADAGLAVQEVVHFHVQARQRWAHAVVVRARAEHHACVCAKGHAGMF